MGRGVAASATVVALTVTACTSLTGQAIQLNADGVDAPQPWSAVEVYPRGYMPPDDPKSTVGVPRSHDATGTSLAHSAYRADYESDTNCWDATKIAEDRRGLPPGLLTAIASVESKMDPRALRIGGHSLHPATSEEARRLAQAALQQSTPVMAGCLQVNLQVHDPEGALWALKPTKAAEWAADYLLALHTQLGSWSAAIRQYGGKGGLAYVQRITARWHAIDKQDAYDEVAEAP